MGPSTAGHLADLSSTVRRASGPSLTGQGGAGRRAGLPGLGATQPPVESGDQFSPSARSRP